MIINWENVYNIKLPFLRGGCAKNNNKDNLSSVKGYDIFYYR